MKLVARFLGVNHVPEPSRRYAAWAALSTALIAVNNPRSLNLNRNYDEETDDTRAKPAKQRLRQLCRCLHVLRHQP